MHRAPYAQSLAGAVARVKAIILAAGYATRLRPLTDDVREAAAAGRRPADPRLDPRRASRQVDEVDEIHVVTNAPQGAGVRARGRRAADVDRPRRRHDARTTTGSARSATCSFVIERAGDRRRPARDRRRQPVRLLPRRLRRVLARRRASRARSPSTTSATLELAPHYGDRRARRRRSHRRTSSRSRPTRRRRSPRPRPISSTARTCRSIARVSRRGQRARPAGPLRRLAATAREPVYGWRFDGRLVRHRRPRAAARGRQPPARRARAARARRLLARRDERTLSAQSWHRHVTRSARSVDGVARSTSSCPRAASSCGVLGRRCSAPRCRARAAPARRPPLLRPLRRARRAWPVERCRECAGRRLAFASARAAVAYAGPAGRSSRAWKERGLRRARAPRRRPRRRARRAAGRRRHHVCPARSDRQLQRGHHPAERLARELGAPLAARRCAAARAERRGRAAGRASARAAAAQRARRLPAAGARSPATRRCSSTTSTRPARPSRPRPRRSRRRARGGSRSSPSRGRRSARAGVATLRRRTDHHRRRRR